MIKSKVKIKIQNATDFSGSGFHIKAENSVHLTANTCALLEDTTC